MKKFTFSIRKGISFLGNFLDPFFMIFFKGIEKARGKIIDNGGECRLTFTVRYTPEFIGLTKAFKKLACKKITVNLEDCICVLTDCILIRPNYEYAVKLALRSKKAVIMCWNDYSGEATIIYVHPVMARRAAKSLLNMMDSDVRKIQKQRRINEKESKDKILKMFNEMRKMRSALSA